MHDAFFLQLLASLESVSAKLKYGNVSQKMKNISDKTQHLLRIVFVSFLIILFRVWHLSVVQRDEKLIEAQKPQQRQIMLRANRGTITDRFGIPLAVNRICYNASVYYGQISQVPVVSWQTDEKGVRARVYSRREYIRKLSSLLAEALDLEATRIEDLIHSKASLFPHVPYLIKAGLTEEEYYRLKMLEKDWLGIHAEIGAERHYPLGKTACHIVGTMGAISQKEYLDIANEMRELQEQVDDLSMAYDDAADEARAKLHALKEKAYTLNDLVGKSGAEGRFEKDLRGVFGKTTYEVDQKGRFVRELPDPKLPIPGNQIRLTISAELQQFAEQLLEKNEIERMQRPPKQPWMRGSAIVALDPHSGEILAMASYPLFNPNDFIPSANPLSRKEKQQNINRWMETEQWIGSIWEGRETLSGPRLEGKNLSWELFLDLLLPPDGPLTKFFQKVSDIKTAVQVQEDFEALRYFAGEGDPFAVDCKEAALPKKRLSALFSEIPSNKDRFFAIGLCRIAVDATRLSDALLSSIGSMKLSTYFSLSQVFHRFENLEKESLQRQFHLEEFRIWREQNQKEFLAEKRREEKERKTYTHPYIDYLDHKERELFEEYWKEKRLEFLEERISREEALKKAVPKELVGALLHSFRSFKQLEGGERDLAKSFYPKGGLGFIRSYAFQTSAPQGSVFKILTSYEALKQGIDFTMIDDQGHDGKGLVVAYSANKTPYPRIYKGGRLPKSSTSHIGWIDLLGAIEQSSNPFFSVMAGDLIKHPDDLLEAARLFGYGRKSGLDLPGESGGHLPTDLATNRTGLYSFVIGQHTLLSTPLQSALFLATVANQGSLLKPKIILDSATEVRTKIDLPSKIRSRLLEGMDRSIWSSKGSARPTAIRSLLANPILLRDYLSLQHQMIGKTGTAEVLWNPFRNPSSKAFLHNHIWFGSIAFSSDPLLSKSNRWDHPELIVIAMQRYGNSGKEMTPTAAQMIRKWREIKGELKKNKRS